MRKLRFLFLWTVVLLVVCVLAACGTSYLPGRQLQSVTISPATAGSQAQFTATTIYIGGQNGVDETGKASCGVTGSFGVFATAPVDPNFPLSQMTPTTPQVFGSAQLNCP